MTAQTFFQATNTLALVAWIARDSVRLGLPWPLRTLSLLLTFLAGPVGFLVHLLARGWLRRETAVEEPAEASGNPHP